jgi:hypothetical protein
VRKANRPPRMTLANRGQAENKRDESPRLVSSYLASSRPNSLASSVSFVSTRRGYTTATAELTSSFLFSFFLAHERARYVTFRVTRMVRDQDTYLGMMIDTRYVFNPYIRGRFMRATTRRVLHVCKRVQPSKSLKSDTISRALV